MRENFPPPGVFLKRYFCFCEFNDFVAKIFSHRFVYLVTKLFDNIVTLCYSFYSFIILIFIKYLLTL